MEREQKFTMRFYNETGLSIRGYDATSDREWTKEQVKEAIEEEFNEYPELNHITIKRVK